MKEHTRNSMLEMIKANIAKHGHHIYVVTGGTLPRFSYTIGVSQVVGAELILAGATYYSAEEVTRIINEIVAILKLKPNWNKLSLEVDSLGAFSLHKVDASWGNTLMLGALDFYNSRDVPALQIVPDPAHWTIDIPDLTQPWSANAEPVWQCLHESTCEYSGLAQSVAVTNLGALRGERVTEAARWEEDQWELFAGAGPDVPPEDVRVVPLGTLLAVDPSLNAVTGLEIGQALWRDSAEVEWHPWGRAER